MRLPKRTHCAYCGCNLSDLKKAERTKDHVPPQGIYPKSLANGKEQRLTVPACVTCRRDFADDDAHFGNVLPFCGEIPPPLMKELFEDVVKRSLNDVDGERRTADLIRMMRPDSQGRTRIWPEENPAFLRVLNRFVRALCWQQDYGWPVPASRVFVRRDTDNLQLSISLPSGSSPGDLLTWTFEPLPQMGDGAAACLMVIRDNMTFFGVVAPSNTNNEKVRNAVQIH